MAHTWRFYPWLIRLLRKSIQYYKSLVLRLPHSHAFKPLLRLWYKLLHFSSHILQGRSSDSRARGGLGPITRPRNEQYEEQANEKTQELPHPFDVPQISVISCNSVPSILPTILSENPRNGASPQTSNPHVPPDSSAASFSPDFWPHQTSRLTASPGVFSSVNVCAPPPQDKEIVCVHPGASDRWTRKIVRSKQNTISELPAMSFNFTYDNLPDDWVPCVHPEGQLYFYRDIGPRRYVTDAYLYDGSVLDEITRFLNRMEGEIRQQSDLLPKESDIVLELCSNPSWNAWGYYMVDHKSRCVYWLAELDVLWAIGEEIVGLHSLTHLKHWIDVSYWRHLELFPTDKIVPLDVMRELTATLLHGSVDLMTSSDSNMPWTNEETNSLLSLITGMESLRETDAAHHITAAVGRLMWFMANERFLNFHGQHGARVGREQDLVGDARGKRTFLITILSPFLFSAPDTHLRQLEKLWVDKKVTTKHWKQHVQTLKDEWNGFIVYATILLNANVAFLAIPLISPNQGNNSDSSPISSPSQIASLLSIIASMGSIILGLILIRQHRTKADESSEETAAHLAKHNNSRFGFEPLAIRSSLPYAFLMWGMVTLLSAIAFLCFDAVNSLPQRIITAFGWAIVLLPTIWIIIRNWEPGGRTPYSFIWNIRRTNIDQSIEGEDDYNSQLDLGTVLRTRWKTRAGRLRNMLPGPWRRGLSSRLSDSS